MNETELERFLEWLNALVKIGSGQDDGYIVSTGGVATSEDGLPGRLEYDLDDARRIVNEVAAEVYQAISEQGFRISTPEGGPEVPDSDLYRQQGDILANFIVNDILESDDRFSPVQTAKLTEQWMAVARAKVGEFNDFLVAFPSRALRGQQYLDVIEAMQADTIPGTDIPRLTNAEADLLKTPSLAKGPELARVMELANEIWGNLSLIREQATLARGPGGDESFRVAVENVIAKEPHTAAFEGTSLFPTYKSLVEIRAQQLGATQLEEFGLDDKRNLRDVTAGVKRLAGSYGIKLPSKDEMKLLTGNDHDRAKAEGLALDKIIELVTAKGNEKIEANASEAEIQNYLAAYADLLLAERFPFLVQDFVTAISRGRDKAEQAAVGESYEMGKKAATTGLATKGYLLNQFTQEDQLDIINRYRASILRANEELTKEYLDSRIAEKKLADEKKNPDAAVDEFLRENDFRKDQFSEDQLAWFAKIVRKGGVDQLEQYMADQAPQFSVVPQLSPEEAEIAGLEPDAAALAPTGAIDPTNKFLADLAAEAAAAAVRENERTNTVQVRNQYLRDEFHPPLDPQQFTAERLRQIDQIIAGPGGLAALKQIDLRPFVQEKLNLGIGTSEVESFLADLGIRGGPTDLPFREHVSGTLAPQLLPFVEEARREDPFRTDMQDVVASALGLPGTRPLEEPSVFREVGQADTIPGTDIPITESQVFEEDRVARALREYRNRQAQPAEGVSPLLTPERFGQQLNPNVIPVPPAAFLAEHDIDDVPFPSPGNIGLKPSLDPLPVFPGTDVQGRRNLGRAQASFPGNPALLKFLQQASGGDVGFQNYLIGLLGGGDGGPLATDFLSSVKEGERERRNAFQERYQALGESGTALDTPAARRQFSQQFNQPTKQEFLPFVESRLPSLRSSFEATPTFVAREQGRREQAVADAETAEREAETTRRRRLRRGRTVIRSFGRA